MSQRSDPKEGTWETEKLSVGVYVSWCVCPRVKLEFRRVRVCELVCVSVREFTIELEFRSVRAGASRAKVQLWLRRWTVRRHLAQLILCQARMVT